VNRKSATKVEEIVSRYYKLFFDLDYFLNWAFCCVLGYIVAFTKFSQYIKYIILEITFYIILLCPSHPHSWNVSTDLIIPFTYMCTQYFHHIHPPTSFPHILSPINYFYQYIWKFGQNPEKSMFSKMTLEGIKNLK
jgi:hypothetical protein